MSLIARGWLRVRPREGRRWGAPCGTDELGDAVEPLLVEVVNWAVAHELVCHEERGPCVCGNATSVRRVTSGTQ